MSSTLTFTQANQPDPVAAIGLQIEVSNAQEDRNERLKLSGQLSQYLTCLRGQCPVCWTLKGILIKKHSPLFSGCRETLGVKYLDHGVGWQDFKRASQSHDTSVNYCFGCGVPAGEFLPDIHRSVPLGRKCAWCDFPQITTWIIYHTADLWNDAQASLGITDVTTLEEFRDWCKTTESRSRFCNAIHLFLWFCNYRGLA